MINKAVIPKIFRPHVGPTAPATQEAVCLGSELRKLKNFSGFGKQKPYKQSDRF